LSDKQAYQGMGARAARAGKLKAPSEGQLDLIVVPDSNVYDGRFATNSVLQEAPDPITKLTWDNAVLMSPATAKAIGVEKPSQIGHTAIERIEVTANVDGVDVTVDAPAWIVPGMADNTLAIAMGYGREFDSYLPYHDAGIIGVSATGFQSVGSPSLAQGVTVKRTGRMYPMACVQRFDSQTPDQGGYDQRPHVRETTVDGFLEDPLFAAAGIIEHGHYPKKTVGEGETQKKIDYVVAHPPTKTLHAPPARGADYTSGHQWAMVVDLNKCTGCNACLVACVAENNIPSVGKNEVRNGRELHWLRMDRYFVGDENDPAVVHQPILCSHCETAPCENVCPVGATTHGPEGTNDMAYNRCIGTRYCANNCPFKVRRFNFYNYASSSSAWEGLKIRNDQVVDVNTEDQLLFMTRNLDVSVRFRGVMEKCTYCIQRINRAKITSKQAGDTAKSKRIIDGIKTACQQVCASDSITFGDKNDPGSAVSKLRSNPRNYALLTELNLRPRTTYLGKVRNPSPNMKKG
jgi:molybdopterin-containing oxidoreductase family iron-sulfur binding subunit